MVSDCMTSRFTLLTQCGQARAGTFSTATGSFETPNFMPVGTRGSVKGVDIERLREIGAQIILVNTYHLSLRPSADIIESAGGIHRFSGWKGPILSDSGGFQVFSLKNIRTISEEGVKFRSHIDGAEHFLSPEVSVRIQETFGVDIAMAFDECPPGDADFETTKKSLDLTHRWARRSLKAKTRPDMSLFGITQGGVYRELRTESALVIAELPFDGCAIGGLSVGELKEQMYEVLSYHPQQLPSDKIRYLMGVGTPQDLVEAVYRGVDIFDCVIPTRAGRFGRAFIRGEQPYLNIKNSRFITDQSPLDETCSCLACRNYSRAYINHLIRVGEMLGAQLLSVHNLAHYLELMKSMREAIKANTFESLYRNEQKRWQDCSETAAII